jgi:hypothetical protein
MSRYYANITLSGPAQEDVVGFLKRRGRVAYVSPTLKSCTVVFHEDLGSQEATAAELSAHFRCPALLVMDYGETVLLYQLYVNGEHADAYVSSPHDELDTAGEPSPEGNPEALCAAFGMEHRIKNVERVLRRPTHPTKGYALAVNRHGELARALGLPLFAAGAGYGGIEIGELPAGEGFEAAAMVKTGGRRS